MLGPGHIRFTDEELSNGVGFDCTSSLRLLVRKGLLASVTGQKKVVGYQRVSWPPPRAFFESGPVGFVYFVPMYFRYYLHEYISDAMGEIEAKEHVLQLEHRSLGEPDNSCSSRDLGTHAEGDLVGMGIGRSCFGQRAALPQHCRISPQYAGKENMNQIGPHFSLLCLVFRSAREDAAFTLPQLAACTGIPADTITAMEEGRQPFPPAALQLMGEAMGLCNNCIASMLMLAECQPARWTEENLAQAS